MNLWPDALRRVALALSFSNLVFLRVWFDLLAQPSTSMYPKYHAGARDFGAALVNVLLVASVTWSAMRFSGKLKLWQRQALVFAGILLVANSMRSVAAAYTPLLRSGAFRFLSPTAIAAIAVIAALLLAIFLLRYFTLAMTFLRATLMMFVPVLLMTIVTAAVHLVTPAGAGKDPPLAALQTEPRRDLRVLWVIFDEWDYRLSFAARPKGVELRELDGLAARSIVGTEVLGPQGRVEVSSMATQVAIPSLLAGQLRKESAFERPHLFSMARARGWNVAVGGWYIPYCRSFAQDLVHCYWDQMYTQATEEGRSFTDSLTMQERSLFETSLYSVFGQSVTGEKHAAEYQALLKFALKEEADDDAGLVYLHFNIPHAPYFYDAQTGDFDSQGSSLENYGDALMLVDKTIGQLVEHLDNKTVLILSADHPLRIAEQFTGVSDPRVPFVVHWPGQMQGFREDHEFSSIITSPLILDVLDGRVKNPQETLEILEAK